MQSEVKELLPEFFYQPEFLRNANGIDLGALSEGTRVSDVELPPWAKAGGTTVEPFFKAL